MNEQKNLLLAIISSLLILLIFQYFFPSENKQVMENEENDFPVQTIEENTSLSREDSLRQVDRIYIAQNSRLKGSIPLVGGRFDDVILKDYKESIEDNAALIEIFSPKSHPLLGIFF